MPMTGAERRAYMRGAEGRQGGKSKTQALKAFDYHTDAYNAAADGWEEMDRFLALKAVFEGKPTDETPRDLGPDETTRRYDHG